MAAVTLPTAMGAPRPESATCAGGSGDHGYTYTVTSQKGVPGDSIVGEYSVSGASGSEYPVSSPLSPWKHLLQIQLVSLCQYRICSNTD